MTDILSSPERLEQTIDNWGSGKTLENNLLEQLGLTAQHSPEQLLRDFIRCCPVEPLKAAAQTINATQKPKNLALGEPLAQWLTFSDTDKISEIGTLKSAFFKNDGDPRTLNKEITTHHPHIAELIARETEKLAGLLDQLEILAQCAKTADLFTLSNEAYLRYQAGKAHKNALDFNDLILETRKLLESRALEWVHYKLDEGIDHILVDEAQDTNRHQWKIIEKLSEEFLSGQGRETKSPRSLFVVGDKKQSIFSFQGADPAAFNDMRHFFEDRSNRSMRTFDPVHLETSFRTTQPVLELVDQVFSDPALAAGLGQETNEIVKHNCFRSNDSGKVELWKPDQTADDKIEKTDGWILPFSKHRSHTGPNASLARKIAARIAIMIRNGEKLASHNRPVEPKDIMVLVRSRTGFMNDLTRELKQAGIPVSGLDRMPLGEQIAVEDCLALARFARLPQDNLSLACVLKSPFIRLNDDNLMELALDRPKDVPLWQFIQKTLPAHTRNWLQEKIEWAASLTPFNFYNEILVSPCPADREGSARRAFATHLGPDCLDPLDEFLAYCLACEADRIFGLEDFITHMEKSRIEIKRNLDDAEKDGNNQVQIMTVHASKGMEAPIVFLPDTNNTPGKAKLPKLIWLSGTKNHLPYPLWTDTTKQACTIYKTHRDQLYDQDYAEYLRLLYVALTRSRDHLIIAAEPKKGKIMARSWFDIAQHAIVSIPDTTETENAYILEYKGIRATAENTQTPPESIAQTMPAWLRDPPPKEQDPKRFIQPSLLGRGDDPALSPVHNQDEYRFKRGILTHKLFQFLPDIELSQRNAAARIFLNKNAQSLPENIQQEILSEVFAVLNDPVFADVFGPESLAEVSITGEIGGGRILSGQIDRLVIKNDRIMIVDFKSNRPSPQNPQDIPENYRDQLKAYKQAISITYPDRPVICALLWTDRAILMPVEIN